MQVKCSGCGTQLAIKQELLGKKIKCPKCQTMLAIQAPKQAAPKAPASRCTAAAASTVKTSAGGMTLKCSCGTTLKVPQSAAGKSVRCPKCQNVLKVPTRPASTPARKPAAKPQSTPTQQSVPQPRSAPAAPAPAPAADPFGDVSWDSMPAGPSPGGGATSFPPVGAANPYAKPAGGGAKSKAKKKQKTSAGASASRDSGPKRDWSETLFSRIHIFFFVLLIGGPFVLISGINDLSNANALKERGETVAGVITDGEEIRRRRRHSYYLTVSFKTNENQQKSKKFNVGGTFYNSHELHENVDILYDPQDAENAVIVGAEGNATAGLVIGLIMILIGLPGTAYIVFVGDIRF